MITIATRCCSCSLIVCTFMALAVQGHSIAHVHSAPEANPRITRINANESKYSRLFALFVDHPANTLATISIASFIFPRDWANIVVAQPSLAHAVDPHDQAAGRVGAGHARVGLHPVGWMVLALLGRQERNRRLQRVQAEIAPFR